MFDKVLDWLKRLLKLLGIEAVAGAVDDVHTDILISPRGSLCAEERYHIVVVTLDD